jgi:hypothetical protein
MKVWTTGTERLAWTISTTDSAFTAGSIGFLSLAATGNTNVNPVSSFGVFTLLNPQAFTITRPTDGTAAAHTAGAPVSLTGRSTTTGCPATPPHRIRGHGCGYEASGPWKAR